MDKENYNLLVVDDHPLFRQGIISVLKEKNIFENIYEAGNALETYNIIDSNKIDFLILDINLPDENGCEILTKIKIHSLKILILTMYNNRFLIDEVFKKGAKGFLSKDDVYTDLVDAVKIIMNGGIFLQKNFIVDDDISNLYFTLSKAEREVFILLAEGKNTKEIAYLLNKSKKTIDNQRLSIINKLNIDSNIDFVKIALKLNLIQI